MFNIILGPYCVILFGPAKLLGLLIHSDKSSASIVWVVREVVREPMVNYLFSFR